MQDALIARNKEWIVTNLQTKAYTACGNAARGTPATIGKTSSHYTTSRLTTPDEACFHYAEDRKTLCLLQNGFRNAVQSTIWMLWIC